eukprot:CAMPEP_0170536374 /NCGR_PEP_ID=MMETSP0209-20121228/102112_1 /TAXON_ID=665100 ORGANISM="Litonotus pictus, Strain P1" /NCGR_SAMPLE_ID=MMETSP0209 /ASSEMBLY_ACC=CAM_ASM_000301 /LENGTH=267 /DNA_ID=CAMNT_0010837731 /DNA_START=11 /DNA_END=814 /DNA_ORIENTATION=-
MKTTLFVIAIICLSSVQTKKIKIKETLASKVKDDFTGANLIHNGDFEEPRTNGSWNLFDSIPGWTTNSGNQVEIGEGSIYNAAFTGTQVCELDGSSNFGIEQNFEVVGNGGCRLQFDWAARQGVAFSSLGILVELNGAELIKKIPNNYNKQHEDVTLNVHEGTNIIAFRGQGTSDGLGSVIDNVTLKCEESVYVPPVVEPVDPVPVDPVDSVDTTDSPVDPVDPTDSPVDPVDPTDSPVDPVDPVDPTDSPVDPTNSPVDPVEEEDC